MALQVTRPGLFDGTRSLIGPAIQHAVREYCPAMEGVVGYHAGWLDSQGRPVSGGTGKAIRPALALLCAQAAGLAAADALPAAVAVEFVHDFSLLHDDVMDADVTRRNRPAAWTVFGTASAILAGDALLVAAYQALLEAGADPGRTARILSETVQRLIRGQARDLEFENRDDVTLQDSIAMAGDKTAALFACSCALGATLAGATVAVSREFGAVGEELGQAFQLVDDILGIWGDASIGKPVLSDLRRRKKSLPVVAALRSESVAALRLGAFYATTGEATEDELRAAAGLVEEAGGRDWARREADSRLTSAARRLDSLSMPEAAREGFASLIDFLRGRTA